MHIGANVGRITLAARYGPELGEYMVHCHNNVHEDNDMFRAFMVRLALLCITANVLQIADTCTAQSAQLACAACKQQQGSYISCDSVLLTLVLVSSQIRDALGGLTFSKTPSFNHTSLQESPLSFYDQYGDDRNTTYSSDTVKTPAFTTQYARVSIPTAPATPVILSFVISDMVHSCNATCSVMTETP